jgi:hypothetical protein
LRVNIGAVLVQSFSKLKEDSEDFAISVSPTTPLLKFALENGAESLFTKPIDFGALRNEIDMRVERAA